MKVPGILVCDEVTIILIIRAQNVQSFLTERTHLKKYDRSMQLELFEDKPVCSSRYNTKLLVLSIDNLQGCDGFAKIALLCTL
jgi:hypothetical protein